MELKNVHFSYPTRPTVKVLQGLNVRVEPGHTVALVGPAGKKLLATLEQGSLLRSSTDTFAKTNGTFVRI